MQTSTSKLVPIIFTATIFLSASLLFFVQPLFAKLVLPQIGGTPAVWTTAMLFFQTVLIAGYAYAHFSTKYLPVVVQVGIHLLLWGMALFFLPLSVKSGLSFGDQGSIAWQTLTLFAVGVGMPFAVLSANAPLIQSWYVQSGGPSAEDPYFLYGASNLGSLGALLAFPLLAEPFFSGSQISWGWAAGFFMLGIALLSSGFFAWKGADITETDVTEKTKYPSGQSVLWWLFLAFIPSSLMLSITAKISRDVGSFPLVWVIPLAIYLLTFVLTFRNRRIFNENKTRYILAAGIGIIGFILISNLSSLNFMMSGLLVFAFFAIAFAAHQALYDARPAKENLTFFYVVMSVGGALGGLFNSIFAPKFFNDLYELHISVLCAALLLLRMSKPFSMREFRIDMLATTLILIPIILLLIPQLTLAVDMALFIAGIFFILGMCAIQIFKGSSILTTYIILLLSVIFVQSSPTFKGRSFFGTHKIFEVDKQRVYGNGTTLHGSQFLADYDKERPTPLSYYHSVAPLGAIMTSDFAKSSESIGIVGLGVGALSCNVLPNQTWQFYEIDALVDQIARNADYFTFMSNCAGDAPTHLGDARIVLEGQTDLKYDILVIDAYSSDAVPVHMITKEAIALFRDRLTDDGILVLHISNRYYDLARPLEGNAKELGLSTKLQRFTNPEGIEGASSSEVVIMASSPETLAEFDRQNGWEPLDTGQPITWTDDFANIFSALR